VAAHPNIDVLPSNRNTSRARDLITRPGLPGVRLRADVRHYEHNYDVILIDGLPRYVVPNLRHGLHRPWS